MTHVHFDEAAVTAAAEKLRAAIASDLEAAGSKGAQARMLHAVVHHYTIAFAREANRGTSTEHVRDATAALLANIAASFVGSMCEVDAPMELRVGIFNNLMLRFSDNVAQDISGTSERNAVYVKSTQGGRA